MMLKSRERNLREVALALVSAPSFEQNSHCDWKGRSHQNEMQDDPQSQNHLR